jgi:hypothetical protein
MTKRLELVFPEENASAHVELLEEEAPLTCDAVWQALPLSGEASHGIYSGTVVGLYFDPTIVVAAENSTTYIQVGDIMYTHYDAGVRHGHPEPVSEIYFAYDRYARPTTPGLGLPATANIFGRIVEGASDFYAVCARLPREGTKLLEARQSSDAT